MDVPATYICPICGREMKSPQGLAAHMRAHKAREEPQEPEKEESLRELVPEITLSNVIEQLSRRIGRLE